MFGFLRSLLRRRGKDQSVFRYWNGSAWIGADPLKLRTALDEAFPFWAQTSEELVSLQRANEKLVAAGLTIPPKLVSEGEAKRSRLVCDLVKAVRKAFSIKDYAEINGRSVGLTDLACVEVLAEYLLFVTDLMEETRPLAIRPASTESVLAESPKDSASALPSTPAASPASAAS